MFDFVANKFNLASVSSPRNLNISNLQICLALGLCSRGRAGLGQKEGREFEALSSEGGAGLPWAERNTEDRIRQECPWLVVSMVIVMVMKGESRENQ